jgi:hypothetical protein
MTSPTSRSRFRFPRLRSGLLLAAAAGFALSLLAVAPADAAERIRFKNGHTITAVKVKIEGDFIYLTMKDGSRVGFPKELVAELEEGVKAPVERLTNVSGYGGRGPSMRELNGYQKNMRQSKGLHLSGNTALRDPSHRGPHTYGFSYKGSGADGGVQRQRQQNGINVFDYMERGTEALAGPQQQASSPAADEKNQRSGPSRERAIPQIKPFEPKEKKKGLKSTNPNLPPSKR